ncbi:MAG: hypothetical protein A2W99_16550 [Bacteroidetes bacterium GWF2_33_16]|nr:MAG: hypothetical protein A2X00_14245 [Bacteroidetes bacterium GWE2_32_14]OFY03360.1 MAG: hypothetical protein A2W99_16550 [Bacteroidetes bacterium GWF2_33_16]
MKKINLQKVLSNKYLYYHILYWVFYVLFFAIQRASVQSNFFSTLKLNLAFLPGVLIFTYFFVEFLVPQFFLKKRRVPFSLISIILLLTYPVFVYFERKYFIELYVFTYPDKYSLYNFLTAIVIFIAGLFPLVGFKVAKYIKDESLRSKQIENDKLEMELKLREAELKLLKGQIQPHFLFNTMNNLYSLSLDKSDKTSEVIIKLSDLLSYIIYDCSAEKVSLEKEIEFIESYIDLEKLRYDKSLKIKTSIKGDIKNKFIAPMILHTFIENSFKHGASKDTGNRRIEINLTINDNWLNFTVFNSKTNEEGKQPSGIGIENAKRRLQLIYPNQHSIEIVSNRNTFNVLLEIHL